MLIWPDRPGPGEAPTAIVVENTQRRDLLAWAASFASSYRPFTAHVRVINFKTCSALFDKPRRRPSQRGIGAAVGAILGEALAASGQSSELTVTDCARTYAYAMGRAYAVGLSNISDEVTSAWQLFASLTNQSTERRNEFERQRLAWAALATASDPGAPAGLFSTTDAVGGSSVSVLRELYKTGQVSESTLFSLRSNLPGLQPLLPLLRDTREVRVQAFQEFVSSLTNLSGVAHGRELPFVVGYLASRLAPGSIEYFRLLKPLEQAFPGLLVWYGICAALQGEDFVASAGGLGRRLYRDLSAAETFPERTRADISVWDLEVFARSESSPVSLLGSAAFAVELIPDVVCVASGRASRPSQPPLPHADASYREAASSRDEPVMTSGELKSLMDELKQALVRVANVQYKIERLTGQGGLDSPRSTTKTRQRR